MSTATQVNYLALGGTPKGTEIPANFTYVCIALSILYISTRLLKAKSAHIFALIVAYLVITNLQKTASEETVDFFSEIDYRLELLGAPSNFHHDANLINLFYEIYAWRQWNPNNFDNAIQAVNNVLQTEQDIQTGLIRSVDNYEIALEQGKIALNLIHGFIYNISNPVLVEKLKNVLERLQKLLERHMRNMRDVCDANEKAKETYDVNSRFINDAYGPKAFDSKQMTNFEFY